MSEVFADAVDQLAARWPGHALEVIEHVSDPLVAGEHAVG
jgi:hypothetical protein